MIEIKNRKFRDLMNAAGLDDVKLYRDDGYFFIASDDDETADRIEAAETFDNQNAFYLNSFGQQTPEQWVDDIESFFKKGEDVDEDVLAGMYRSPFKRRQEGKEKMFTAEKNAIDEIPGVAYIVDRDGYHRLHLNPEVLPKIENIFDEVLVEDSPFDKMYHYTKWDGQWQATPYKVNRWQDDTDLYVFQYHTANPTEYDRTLCGTFKKDFFHPHVSRSKKLYNQITDALWSRIKDATKNIKEEGIEMKENLYENIYKASHLKEATSFKKGIFTDETLKATFEVGVDFDAGTFRFSYTDDSRKRNNTFRSGINPIPLAEAPKYTFLRFLREENTQEVEDYNGAVIVCNALDVVTTGLRKVGGEQFNLSFMSGLRRAIENAEKEE